MGVMWKGLDRMRVNMRKRIEHAEDPRAAMRAFERYFSEEREPNRRNNGGIIRGRYGRGSRKWAPNKPSTIKKKGHGRVLYSTPTTSELLDGLELKSWWQRGSAKYNRATRVVFRVESDKDYSVYLQDGRDDMAARAIFDLFEGDARKMVDLASRNALRPRTIGWGR